MSDFIGKPFNPDVLFSILLKWLDQRMMQETLGRMRNDRNMARTRQ
jgi:hypothetical protein